MDDPWLGDEVFYDALGEQPPDFGDSNFLNEIGERHHQGLGAREGSHLHTEHPYVLPRQQPQIMVTMEEALQEFEAGWCTSPATGQVGVHCSQTQTGHHL